MEAEKTCYFLQLVIVASSVRRRNKKVEDEGSKRVDSEIKVDNHFDILNDAHDLSKMLGEIPQEINVPSGNDAQETNKDENCEHPAELEDLNDFKKVPSDAMNPNQDSDSPFPLSLVYEHGVNIESSSGTSIFDNRDYGPVTSRTIDRSIENIVQSATKMSTIIMGLKTIWSKMQKEKEVWREQKAQIMRELEKHQVKRSKDPIKIRIQELDCEIAEAKRLMDSMKNSVRCP
jgi:predicted RNase H-like nuclease (RuvC/YqgF family)